MIVIGVGLVIGDAFSKVAGVISVIFFFSGRNMKKVQAFIAGVFEGGIRVLWFAHCYNIRYTHTIILK